MPLLSIVSPVYKAEKFLTLLVTSIDDNLKKYNIDYEIILVNDASPDKSWSIIKSICSNNPKVKGVNLSRNFGQHYAIAAGLEHSRGEWVVVMDCDLQDLPEEIPNLYFKATNDDLDLVFARRVERQDSLIKKLSSKLFYYIFSYLTNTKQDHTIGNFGIYNNKVIQAILSMNDKIRYFPTMSQWVGFNKGYLDVKHAERDGESSYSWSALFNLAFNNIVAFSDKPLRLTVRLGAFISIASFTAGVIFLFRYLSGAIEVLGFTSLIISLWFLSGVIILVLGVVGLYVGKIFEQVKHRPYYIVSEKLNLSQRKELAVQNYILKT